MGKRTTIQQYDNNNTTKQQTQDYETTRRRYATRRLKSKVTFSIFSSFNHWVLLDI